MLPKRVDCVIINTGNLISSKELKKKAMQTPSEEVFDSVCGTFHSWLETMKKEAIEGNSSVLCTNPHAIQVEPAHRADLKISVKVFLENFNSEDLKESISQVMRELNVDVIESLILAWPPMADKFDLARVKPLWTELETSVRDGKVITIGVSDLDTQEIADFYECTQIKPSVNQVNLESCCIMPPEMITFAKENDIQLLTHNDPKLLLPKAMLHKILEPAVPVPEDWYTSWIVRYSVIVKCRGIIQNKGYLLQTVKRPKLCKD